MRTGAKKLQVNSKNSECSSVVCSVLVDASGTADSLLWLWIVTGSSESDYQVMISVHVKGDAAACVGFDHQRLLCVSAVVECVSGCMLSKLPCVLFILKRVLLLCFNPWRRGLIHTVSEFFSSDFRSDLSLNPIYLCLDTLCLFPFISFCCNSVISHCLISPV